MSGPNPRDQFAIVSNDSGFCSSSFEHFHVSFSSSSSSSDSSSTTPLSSTDQEDTIKIYVRPTNTHRRFIQLESQSLLCDPPETVVRAQEVFANRLYGAYASLFALPVYERDGWWVGASSLHDRRLCLMSGATYSTFRVEDVYVVRRIIACHDLDSQKAIGVDSHLAPSEHLL
ncbi:hypothetical protein TSMEX_004772 [Taenia solium]|eukprot:TsM_000152600 transcript=TsM_000152600 gene=TsM_000152600